MMGCRHQRCNSCGGSPGAPLIGFNGCDQIGRGHGFRLCGNGRTIMYQNGCNGRTRMARWSNQEAQFNECGTGNWFNTNIRTMRNHACEVADFRPNPLAEWDDFSIIIEGAASGNACDFSEWMARVSDGDSSFNSMLTIGRKVQMV